MRNVNTDLNTLNEAVARLDEAVDNGMTVEESFDLDMDALLIVARRRCTRAEGLMGSDPLIALMLTCWMDGYATAKEVAQNGS